MLHWKVTNQILVAEEVQSNTSLLHHLSKQVKLGGYFSRLVVSELLLALIETTNRKPKRRFLLGLGEPFEPNPCDITVTVRTTKRISWWRLKWSKRNLPSRSHCCQIGGGPLNRLLNSICFVKKAPQRARRCKRSPVSRRNRYAYTHTHTRTGMHGY